jgi:hypothetical protein
MTGRNQVNRSTTTGSYPAALTRAPGELFANLADMRLMIIDASQAARDLVGVRPYNLAASYVTGDLVAQGGQMYRAKASISAHPFNPTEWDQYLTLAASDLRYTTVAQNNTLYVQLGGSTMTGLLTLSGGPTSPLHAATKAYVDAFASGYLPLTGGTISGDLAVTGSETIGANLQANAAFIVNALHVSPNNGWEWYFVRDGAANHIQNHASGWLDYWSGVSGDRYWVQPGYTQMTLTGAGDLIVHGGITGAQLTSNGQINAAAEIITPSGMQAGYMHSTGNLDIGGTATAGALSVGGGGITTSGNSAVLANLGVSGQLSAGSILSATGIILRNDPAFTIDNGAAGRILNWSSNNYIEWNSSNNNQSMVVNGTTYWQVRSDTLAGNPNGPVAGTAWLTISDPALKTVLKEPVEGLGEVLMMEPVKYYVNHEDPAMRASRGYREGEPYVHIGFMADVMAEIVPDAVIQIERDDVATWYINDSALVAVAINAIKQLEARVVYLEQFAPMPAPTLKGGAA